MKLIFQDCRFGKKISDGNIKQCPQYGSENICIIKDEEILIPKPQPKTSTRRKNKGKIITRVGGYILLMAITTLAINYVMPTSTSYAFILFIFPVEIVIGLILLVIGFIIEASKKRKTQQFCQECSNELSAHIVMCDKCGVKIPGR